MGGWVIRRAVAVAAWSVLTFLLLSKDAVAYSETVQKNFHLNRADSYKLFNQMNVPKTFETFSGTRYGVKRFTSIDGSVQVACSQSLIYPPITSTVCGIMLDSTRANTKTKIQTGYVYNSAVFQMTNKLDIQAVLRSFFGTQSSFYSSETVVVTDAKGQRVTVPRFHLQCPRDWVFDVVECNGYIIGR
jgi:hypothetical protein